MKKLFILFAAALIACTSCSKFPHEGTATESLAGTWMCTVYYEDGGEWVYYYEADFSTFNTAANLPTEMWVQDGFWHVQCKVDCDASKATFGTPGKVYDDIVYGAGVKIFNGKVTPDGTFAPVSGGKCDKIEMYVQYNDDEPEYGYTYYIVGYRYTGYPEDDGVYKDDWDLPAIN